jgi:hypothetical protein
LILIKKLIHGIYYNIVEVKSYPFEYVGNNYIKYYDNIDGETFWKTFFKLERPVVCIKENDIFFPLYQYKNNTSVKLCSVIVNCPPVVNIGLNFDVGKLLDNILFYEENKKLRQLEVEEKEIEVESKKMDLLLKKIDLDNKLKANYQHMGITRYLEIARDNLITQQDIMDYNYEVKSRKVDILV